MKTIEKPEGLTDEHLEFLDLLRESGVTQMFGAGIYLEETFGLPKAQARKILSYWMQTFSERHLS